MKKIYAIGTGILLTLTVFCIVGAIWCYGNAPPMRDGTVTAKFQSTIVFGNQQYHFVVNASGESYLETVSYYEYVNTAIGETWYVFPWEYYLYVLGVALGIIFAVFFGIFTFMCGVFMWEDF